MLEIDNIPRSRTMKRALYIIAALCLVITSCTNPKQEKREQKQHPDLALYELKGKVKEVKVLFNSNGYDELGYTLLFDAKGMCTTHRYDNLWNDEEIVKDIERNTERQITSYTAQGAKSKEPKVETHFIYDAQGRVANTNAIWYGETVVTENLVYDSKGRLKKTVRNVLDPGYPVKETITYRYLATDSLNNWTRREALKIDENARTGEEEVISETIYTEKREISYHE
jgi:hypothetical protein